MTEKKHGKRRGVPKTPAELHYKRRYFSLPPDVVEWLERQPSGQRSRIVAEALRDKMTQIDSSIDSSPDTKPITHKRRKA